jgi:transcription elongation factor Elf1
MEFFCPKCKKEQKTTVMKRSPKDNIVTEVKCNKCKHVFEAEGIPDLQTTFNFGERKIDPRNLRSDKFGPRR